MWAGWEPAAGSEACTFATQHNTTQQKTTQHNTTHQKHDKPQNTANPNAVGYVRYLLDTLAKRDLFSWLTLAPSRWWHALLYRDAYNFGGVEAVLPEGLWEATARGAGGGGGGGGEGEGAPDLSSLDVVDPTQIGTPGGPKLRWGLRSGPLPRRSSLVRSDQRAAALMPICQFANMEVPIWVFTHPPKHPACQPPCFPPQPVPSPARPPARSPGSCLWNLKEFLPPALQEHLVLLLAEFVYRPWKEAAAAAMRGASQGGSQAVADAQQAQDVQVGRGRCLWSLAGLLRKRAAIGPPPIGVPAPKLACAPARQNPMKTQPPPARVPEPRAGGLLGRPPHDQGAGLCRKVPARQQPPGVPVPRAGGVPPVRGESWGASPGARLEREGGAASAACVALRPPLLPCSPPVCRAAGLSPARHVP